MKVLNFVPSFFVLFKEKLLCSFGDFNFSDFKTGVIIFS